MVMARARAEWKGKPKAETRDRDQSDGREMEEPPVAEDAASDEEARDVVGELPPSTGAGPPPVRTPRPSQCGLDRELSAQLGAGGGGGDDYSQDDGDIDAAACVDAAMNYTKYLRAQRAVHHSRRDAFSSAAAALLRSLHRPADPADSPAQRRPPSLATQVAVASTLAKFRRGKNHRRRQGQ